MKHYLILAALILPLVACHKAEPPRSGGAEVARDVDLALNNYPQIPDKSDHYKLPPTIVLVSDVEENFGIDVAALDRRDMEIISSAWKNYQLIVEGKHPDCPSTFGLSDGGSVMYDCGSYEIMRVKGLSGFSGYDYGPSLNLLNGHTLERLKHLTPTEMERLEKGAP